HHHHDQDKTKPFSCNRCGRKYKWKTSLHCHQRDECGKEPQYKCIYCHYRTKIRSNWIRHEKTHTKPGRGRKQNEIYRCDKCKKIYKNKGSLMRHTKNECGIVPQFNCLYCNYKSKQKSNLLRHTKNIHGISTQTSRESRTKRRSRNALPHKRYNCHKCGIKSYVNKSTLNRHLREECNMEPQNSCPYCNKRIHQRCNFQRHIKKVHHNILLQNEFQGEIVTTKLLLKALSTSLSNAKDWDGHRKDRDGQRKDRDGQRKDQ
ncbi:PRDM9 methyltransferase, partial [Pseudoatta argentina]